MICEMRVMKLVAHTNEFMDQLEILEHHTIHFLVVEKDR
jgi:hypothetical protein